MTDVATDGTTSTKPAVTRTLTRGLLILETLAEVAQGATLSEITRMVELDKATTMRLLATLIDAGYVTRHPGKGVYRLTGKVLRLSRNIERHDGFRQAARGVLSDLRDRTGESVHIGILDEGKVMYIDKYESTRSVRLVSAVGQVMPLNTTALGKAMLAAMSPARRDALLAGTTMERRTEHSITDRDAFLAELTAIADRGYSIDSQENELQVLCVGAAVNDPEGEVIGAVSISGPAYRTGPLAAELGERCRTVARAITATLAEAAQPVEHPG